VQGLNPFGPHFFDFSPLILRVAVVWRGVGATDRVVAQLTGGGLRGV
jgi:hypothetical protein